MEASSLKRIGSGVLALALLLGIFAYDAMAQSQSPFPYPTGVPRCQITDPITTATIFMRYPFPAIHDAAMSTEVMVPPGEQEEVWGTPARVPMKSFKLAWSAVVDRADQRTRYDLLQASDGYTAELSSSASGNDGIQPFRNYAIPLVGSLDTKIKYEPITFTITIKKNGTPVATCAVNVRHSANWIEQYDRPATAQPTGNSYFPYTLKSIIGTDFWNRAFPTPAEYSSPFKKFVGRYYDSITTGSNFQSNSLGFYWAGLMHQGPVLDRGERIYVGMGSSLGAYDKSTFLSRVAAGPLSVFKGTFFNRSGYYHSLVPWDKNFSPMDPQNGVMVEFTDSRFHFIGPFEMDDRGYIYFDFLPGIVVLRDQGGELEPAAQIVATDNVPPPGATYATYAQRSNKNSGIKIVSGSYDRDPDFVHLVKANGDYYMVARGHAGTNSMNFRGTSLIYNVNNPRAPELLREQDTNRTKPIIADDDIEQAGEIVAAQIGNGNIRIYSASDYIEFKAAKKEFTAPAGGYRGLAVDSATGRFFSIGYSSAPNPKSNIPGYALPKAFISVFAPGPDGSAGSYTETRHELAPESMGGVGGSWPVAKYIFTVGDVSGSTDKELRYHNGYLLALGGAPARPGIGQKPDIRLWIFQNGQPVWLDTHGFLPEYYSTAYRGNGGFVNNASILTIGGKDYLFIGTYNIGDVYELEPVSRDSTSVVPPPGPQPPPAGTSTPPIISDNACLNNYQYLCDQISELTKRICALVPSACVGGVLKQ